MSKRTERPDLKVDTRGYERRMVGEVGVKTRAEGDDEGDAIGFYGHAALFDSPTVISSWWDEWEETIARGAFKKTIKEADVRFLLNHDPNFVLARNTSDTLRLAEDDVGLEVDADMGPTSYAKDLAINLDRGDISQMSFAFEVMKEEWDFDSDPIKRTILEVKLWDVAAVTYPAYTDTDAALRSAGFEKLCRAMDIDKDHRNMLLQSLISGEMGPDLAPTLEAAGEALQRMAHANEPAVGHSLEAIQLRHRALGKRYGLAS